MLRKLCPLLLVAVAAAAQEPNYVQGVRGGGYAGDETTGGTFRMDVKKSIKPDLVVVGGIMFFERRGLTLEVRVRTFRKDGNEVRFTGSARVIIKGGRNSRSIEGLASVVAIDNKRPEDPGGSDFMKVNFTSPGLNVAGGGSVTRGDISVYESL